jgi:hypothetical protein
MSDEAPTDVCLNCGAALTGAFCSGCGQRVLPPDATLSDLARDTWEELAGYDGRFLRTLRWLLGRPGRLTSEVLAGRRNRYISPVRLYLFASFAFFLTAAIAPPMVVGRGPKATLSNNGQTQVIELDSAELIAADDRAAALAQLDRAPWWAAFVMRPILTDPIGFRARLYENMPRVLFLLVPVFAVAVGLFFRGSWLQHMVFSLHLHAAVFLILLPRELVRFSGNVYLLGATQVLCGAGALGYSVAAMKHAYAERWARLLLKLLPVVTVYLVAYAVAIVAAIILTAA